MTDRRNMDLNIWPSVADMFLAALMVMAVVWFAQTLHILSKMSEAQTETQGTVVLTKELDAKKSEIEELKAKLKMLENSALSSASVAAELEAARKLNKKLLEDLDLISKKLASATADHRQPPVFSLPDAKYRFLSGQAELTAEGQQELRDLLDGKASLNGFRFVDALNHPKVNTIVVIGHTDSVAVDPSKGGNDGLDQSLGRLASGEMDLKNIKITSNADLGLLRAFQVRKLIEEWMAANHIEKRIHLRCYSAAQTAPPSEELSDWNVTKNGDPARRRVEILFLGIEPGDERQ